MSGRILKRVRVGVGLFFLAVLLLTFVDIHGDVPIFIKEVGLSLQFIPSVILLLGGGGWAALGCVAVLVLTVFFGRVYCSTLCPLGVSMDVAAAARLRPLERNAYGHAKAHPVLQLSILCLSLLPVAFGSLGVVNFLDPYSTFGRLASALARPVVIVGNNGGAWLLERMGSYALLPIPFNGVSMTLFIYSATLFFILVWLARNHGRLYCNTVCPVGTLLGMVAKFSWVKVRLDAHACVECGRCEKVCKSQCIDIPAADVDSARCVACFNCLAVCPVDAVSFSRTEKQRVAVVKSEGQSRRKFLVAAGALFLFPAESLARLPIKITVPSKIPLPLRAHPILPPGSLGLDHFLRRCTACQACVVACPSQVLQPNLAGYGTDGLFMPHLDPDAGFCNLKCNACGEVCPTDAIKPFSMEEKQVMQMGVVRFVRENCIVVLQGTACGACSEHCPTKAVTMIDEQGKLIPKVDTAICLGCGACEHVCPARPHKAIYVEPHRVLQTAKLPESGNTRQSAPQPVEDFPF